MSEMRHRLNHTVEKLQEISRWIVNEAQYSGTPTEKRDAFLKAKEAIDEAVRELGWADLALEKALGTPKSNLRFPVPMYGFGSEGPERHHEIDPLDIPDEIVGYWVEGVKFPEGVIDHTFEHSEVPKGHVSRAVYRRSRTRGGKFRNTVAYYRSDPIVVYPIKEARDMYGYGI